MHDLVEILDLRADKRSERRSETGHSGLMIAFQIGTANAIHVAAEWFVESDQVKLKHGSDYTENILEGFWTWLTTSSVAYFTSNGGRRVAGHVLGSC